MNRHRPYHRHVACVAPLLAALTWACSDPSPDTDTNTDTETDTDTEWAGDCSNLPTPEIHQLDGPIAAADVAFDLEGRLIGSSTQALFRTTSPTGMPALWVPHVSNRSALRQLSDGRVAVVEEMYRRVLLFTPEGSSAPLPLAKDLDDPFGLVEGLDGAIYIADNSRVMRVEPDSGEPEIWLETPGFVSRWVSFDLGYDGLFIGGRTRTIFRTPIGPSGEAGIPVEWGTLPSPAPEPEPEMFLVDGLGVDACGNVYVAEFYTRGLYRIPAGGGEGERLVEWSELEYGHGLQWGSGLDEWSETSLYLPQPYNEFNVVRVEIGVPSKPRLDP